MEVFFHTMEIILQEKSEIILVVPAKALSLHPQSRNDGGIAQLVRAHD